MNKLLKILGILMLSLAIIAIGFYVYQFGTRPLSENPEQWGQFGDYIGGILNPIIGIINILILAYVALILEKQNSHREVKPLCLFRLSKTHNENNDSLNVMEFRIKNCGLGPMIIEKVTLSGADNKIYSSFEEIIKNLPSEIPHRYYNIGKESIIDKGEEKILLGLYQDEGDGLSKELINILNRIEIKVEYKDIYGNLFTKTDIFGETF